MIFSVYNICARFPELYFEASYQYCPLVGWLQGNVSVRSLLPKQNMTSCDLCAFDCVSCGNMDGDENNNHDNNCNNNNNNHDNNSNNMLTKTSTTTKVLRSKFRIMKYYCSCLTAIALQRTINVAPRPASK